MKAVLNGICLAIVLAALGVVVVGIISYVAYPNAELAKALSGVLGPLAGLALCGLGFVLLGRRR